MPLMRVIEGCKKRTTNRIAFSRNFLTNTSEKKLKKRLKKLTLLKMGRFRFWMAGKFSVLFSNRGARNDSYQYKCGRFDCAHLCC